MGRFFRPEVILGELLLLFSAVSDATVKQWKGPMLNWHSAVNWHGGQTPCSADLVQFDETWAPSAVYIQSHITVHHLTLPLDGDLVLGDINISLSDDTSCGGRIGRQLSYLSPAPGDWDNPLNWDIMSGGKVADSSKMPPADRLPCKKDTVIFPPNTSVSVRVARQVKVGSLVVDNTLYNTAASAANYLSSHVGKSQVRQVALKALSISGDSCALGTICPCGNSNQRVHRSSCSYSTPSCPAVVKCINPVQLADDCCATCGALFNITVDSSFNYDAFKNALSSKLKTFGYRVHVFSPSMVQLLVTGVRGQQLSGQLTNNLRSAAFTLTSSTPIKVQKSAPLPTPSPPPTTPTPSPTTPSPTTPAPTTKQTLPPTKPVIETTAPKSTSQAPPDVITVTLATEPGRRTEGQITTAEERTRLVTLCATLKEGDQQRVVDSNSGGSSSSTDKEPWYILAALTGIFLLFAVLLIIYQIARQRKSQKTVLRSVSMRSRDGQHHRTGFENPMMSFHKDKDADPGEDAFVQLVNDGQPMADDPFFPDGAAIGSKNNPLYDSVEQVKKAMEKEFQLQD